MLPLRIYLAGRVCVEAGDLLVEPHDFPGRQGRLAFAFLVLERGRPVPRDALAEVLWRGERAPAWESALHAVVSKLRGVLSRVGLDGASSLAAEGGCYELRLPGDAWVDFDAAADAIHQAEAALRHEDPRSAYGPSAVAHHIARRPLLPGEDSAWLDGKRARLRSILVRALECRAHVYLWNGEHALAIEAARDAVDVEPFRETGHQLLMRAHASAGNTAEALRAYEKCRRAIADELGVDPSPSTRQVYEQILASV
jgi:DNA-binding SARP family transcriptional activator